VAFWTFLITHREIKVTVALYTTKERGRQTLSTLYELLLLGSQLWSSALNNTGHQCCMKFRAKRLGRGMTN